MSAVGQVTSATTTAPPGAGSAQRWAALPLLARTNVSVLAVLTVGLTVLLWPHWTSNPELSHSFLMPVVFVLLWREARSGKPRFIGTTPLSVCLFASAITLGLLMLGASGLYATALDWSHALVVWTLTAALTLFWWAAVIALAHRSVRFVPLNWTAIVAPPLWLLCAPIPPGTYTRLTIGLQLFVTENVLRALHILGIPASRHGNIIDLAAATVGVEEACSGVRSLISCIFAGLFFSATLVRAWWARLIVIGLAAPCAIAMNFLRSLTLTVLASKGVDISGKWHDLTGYAVLGMTAVLLAGTALALDRMQREIAASKLRRGRKENAAPEVPGSATATRAGSLQPWLFGALTIAAAVGVFFVVSTHPSSRRDLPAPDLLAVLPATSPGWQVETSRDLYQFSATLRTDHLAQRTYLRTRDGVVQQVTIYLAYWRAGQASVSLVASHTPDACWPGSGWTLVSPPNSRAPLMIGPRRLPEAEAREFKSGDYPQYVWFWQLYDGHPIGYRDPYSARELLRSAMTYGFSHDGDQMFVRVSSNVPWSQLANEPLILEVFTRLHPLGL